MKTPLPHQTTGRIPELSGSPLQRSRVLSRVLLMLSLAAFLALPMATQAAEPAAASATKLRSQVVDAYHNLKTYQSYATIKIHLNQGDKKNIQSQDFDYHVAFDRPNGQLKVTRPDVHLLVKDKKLTLRALQIKERHLVMDAPGSFKYDDFIKVMPFIASPEPFDLALAMDGSVIPADAKALAPDSRGRPGLTFHKDKLTVTLRVNSKTHLIHHVNLKTDPNPAGQYITMEYELAPKVNTKAPADTFAMNLGQSKAVGSFQELIGQQTGESTLKGQAAPGFTLKDSQGKTVSLKDLEAKHKIVVLDFWATWCGPCRRTLPMVQNVSNWVAKNKYPVAIYTVNQMEQPSEANAMFKEMKLNLPILMDSDGAVSQDYGIRAIPQMMVIADGKVQQIHLGASPLLERDLKAQITEMLKKK